MCKWMFQLKESMYSFILIGKNECIPQKDRMNVWMYPAEKNECINVTHWKKGETKFIPLKEGMNV